MGKRDNKKSTLYSKIGRVTRRCSWPLVIFLVGGAALLVVIGLGALALGIPDIKDNLFDYAQGLGSLGILGSINIYWKEITQKYHLLKLQNTTGHIVVCGLGEKGRQLIDLHLESAVDKKRVAVIESKKDHPDIPGCWERGVVVITGDATDKSVLDIANAGRAGAIFAVTGDDTVNIEIAHEAHRLATALHATGESVKLRCHSHVIADSVREVFSEHELFRKDFKYFDASMFSVFDSAARYLFEKFPPDRYARIHNVTGDTLHLRVIGFGKMGQALVKQVARIGHYHEWKRLEITITDENICQKAAAFLGLYGDGGTPSSFVVKDISLVFDDTPPETLSALSGNQPTNIPSLICIALDNDALAVALAMRVRMVMGSDDIPIVACLNTPLAEMMTGKEFVSVSSKNIHTFNIFDLGCRLRIHEDFELDLLAQHAHNTFLPIPEKRNPGKRSHRIWDKLPEDLKNSNRSQADHISIKLRAIGVDTDACAELVYLQIGKSLRKQIAETEHRRWCATLQMDGWSHAEMSDDARKKHDCLIPFHKLSITQKKKDFSVLKTLPALVKTVDWQRYTKFINECQEGEA